MLFPSVFFFLLFFQCYGDPRDLHSFPTRRSSDLAAPAAGAVPPSAPARRVDRDRAFRGARGDLPVRAPAGDPFAARSEEHTSELQSRRDLVCRLLLEKKKTKNAYRHVESIFNYRS